MTWLYCFVLYHILLFVMAPLQLKVSEMACLVLHIVLSTERMNWD